jgi:hypothetical protein
LALAEVEKRQIVEMAVGIMPFSSLATCLSAKNLQIHFQQRCGQPQNPKNATFAAKKSLGHS